MENQNEATDRMPIHVRNCFSLQGAYLLSAWIGALTGLAFEVWHPLFLRVIISRTLAAMVLFAAALVILSFLTQLPAI